MSISSPCAALILPPLLHLWQIGRTALHKAAWNGHLEVVKYLVSAGADVAAREEVRACRVLNSYIVTPSAINTILSLPQCLVKGFIAMRCYSSVELIISLTNEYTY